MVTKEINSMYMINKKPKSVPKSEYLRAYRQLGDLHPTNVLLRCDYIGFNDDY